MAINITFDESTTLSEKPFPKLMIRKNGCTTTIIWALGIHGSYIKANGVYSNNPMFIAEPDDLINFLKTDDWSPNGFTDYNEPITLQNA